MQKITNNEELILLVSSMDINKPLFAIKTKDLIEIFKTKRSFSKKAKTIPNAVQGLINPFNYTWYMF